MPAGMVGLLIAAMFAATMSSMDSGLNRNAGIFVKNFYEPIIRRNNASESELMLASRVTSAACGLIIIAVALFINSLKGLSLFDAMMYVGALLGFPMTIPTFLGFFLRRTPDWAAWATMLVGAVVSYLVGFRLQAHHLEGLFGLEQAFTVREWLDLKVAIGLVAHVVVTGGFFCLSALFFRGFSPQRELAVRRFFHNLDTPLVNESEIQHQLDNRQRILLGRMIAVLGVFIMAMMVLPNPVWGRIVFLLCGAIVFGVGLLLFTAVDDSYDSAAEKAASSI
jgi:hypothetical protein